MAVKKSNMPRKKTVSAAALEQYKKDYSALQSYLVGRGFTTALKAMSFAELHHTGFRKDGYTPEFHHQILIAFTIINLRGLDSAMEERCLTLAFLHDLLEDKGITHSSIAFQFNEEIADQCRLLAKKYFNEAVIEKSKFVMVIKTNEHYAQDMSEDAAVIITKGADRGHNVQSMHGAFTIEKRQSYIKETNEVHLPMLKLGRKRFPEYYHAFRGLTFMLKRQLELHEAYLTDERTVKTAAAREMAKAVNDRTRIDEVAALKAQVARLDMAIERLNEDLERASADRKETGERCVQLGMKVDRLEERNSNMVRGMVASASKLPAKEKMQFWQGLGWEAGGAFPFEMPSELDKSFRRSDGTGIDEI